MIQYTTGNIFKSECEVITITVNCVGVMGAGIALTCKKQFPATFRQYRAKCQAGEYLPGQPVLTLVDRPLLLFPTKDDWRNDSKYEWIEEGLRRIADNSDRFKSIAIPPLGCGHGKLQWTKVRELIEEHLGHLDNVIEVYEPVRQGTGSLRETYKVEYLENNKDRIHSKIILA